MVATEVLIFTIFGAPRIVYKTDFTEKWVYGERVNLLSYEFLFSKMDSSFVNNNYYLERSDIYRKSWFIAVDTWRAGRIYTVTH